MNVAYSWLAPFTVKDYAFQGAWIVYEGADGALLVSEQGTSIALSQEVLSCLRRQELPATLPIKLLHRGFSALDGIQYSFHKPPHPCYFIIDLTDQCNYDCIYCFRDGANHASEKERSIPLQDILTAIQKYCNEQKIKKIGIQAWGGEPLLKSENILEISKFFRETNIKAAVEVETNAALLTENLTKQLFQAGIRIGVSIDGFRLIQESQRRARNQQSSYDQTLQGIRLLKKYYGNQFGSISVITKYSIPFVSEMVEHLRQIGVQFAKFNIVRDNRFAREKELVPQLHEISSFYRHLFEEVCHCWENGYPFTEGTIQTRLENLALSRRNNCCESCGCTGGRSIFSFDRHGGVFPCEMTDFPEEQLGSLKETPELSELLDRNRESIFFQKGEIEECKVCPWQYYCQGGCTSRVHYAGEHGIDRVACTINTTLYPLLAELMVTQPNLAHKMLIR